MSRVCEITKARPNVKNLVSHANNKTKKRQLPNLQQRKIWVPELGRELSLRISTRALRTLRKQSNTLQFLRDSGIKI
ncbi:MAG: 50S ribosomal protein L28 [candidate division FCPU426 bacterium]